MSTSIRSCFQKGTRFFNRMIRRGACFVAFLGAVLLPAQAAEPAGGQFDSLIKSAPFGQAAPVPGGQAGNGGPLEFRGVFQDKGEYYFSLHEPGSRTGSWVGLKESGQPFVVESYDSDKGSIQVKYRGQTLNLTLKLAQVIVQAPPPIPQQPTAPNTINGAPPGVVANPVSGDEATRMAQVAEEIRRRRALRTPPAPLPLPQPQAPATNTQARPGGPVPTRP